LLKTLEAKKASGSRTQRVFAEINRNLTKSHKEYGVQQENMKSFAYADDLVKRTLALTDKQDPNNVKAYMELLKEWRAMGGAQDYVLARCHVIVRSFRAGGRLWLHRQARGGGSGRRIKAAAHDIVSATRTDTRFGLIIEAMCSDAGKAFDSVGSQLCAILLLGLGFSLREDPVR
jgi:hypothetical protein